MNHDNQSDDDMPSSPPQPPILSTDDPSQMTEGSHTLDSKKSTTSLDKFRSVLQQAGEILVGRLPTTDEEANTPSVIQFPGSTANDATRSLPVQEATNGEPQAAADTTEHGVASSQTAINFLQDRPADMTLGRRMALSLQDKVWYNPSLTVAREVEELENSEAFKLAQETYQSPRGGRLMDAYPFTVSKREKPSLAKAWACEYNSSSSSSGGVCVCVCVS